MTASQTDPICPLLPKLRRRARRLVSDPAQAEDLVQETALRLWQRLADPQGVQAPERYGMIVLHNLARQHWRQARPMEELSEEMAQTQPLAPARIACSELCAAIERLPPDQAELMRMVWAGETSPQVLARTLGLPPGTVMSRLGRARATLRGEIGLEGSISALL